MVCKIYELEGTVPTDCLFKCQRPQDCQQHAVVKETPPTQAPRCRRCGATGLRWRQQGGKWQLFTQQPGVPHECPPRNDAASDFGKFWP